MTHSNGSAPDGMSKTDRDTIATLMRRQEKVAKSDARYLAKERLADMKAAEVKRIELPSQ